MGGSVVGLDTLDLTITDHSSYLIHTDSKSLGGLSGIEKVGILHFTPCSNR